MATSKRRPTRLRAAKRNGVQQGALHDRQGLLWLEGFRWLRARELALLLWPEPAARGYALKSAEALVHKWNDKGWLIARTLPSDEAGRAHAYVLSERGAAALAKMVGRRVRTGKDWGTHKRDKATGKSEWRPPAIWRHELLQTSLLALVRARQWPDVRTIPERALRRYGAGAKGERVPDGLIEMPLEDGTRAWFWLEVENTRKSGHHMIAMADKLIAVANEPNGVEACRDASGKPLVATAAALACVVGQRDERDHVIHHGSRVQSAIQRRASRNVCVMLFAITTDVFGTTVDDVQVGWFTFKNDPPARGIADLEWHEEAGVRIAPWGQMELAIWKRAEPGDPWGWSVALCPMDRHRRRIGEPEEVVEGTAVSSKEAKRAAYAAAQGQPSHYHPAGS